jgi:phosphoribosyl 1,2-cyclic phosphate phosphodiesterase
MKITFLGTSAANAFPESFCRCVNCEAARREGGKSLRKRAALLVNDDLLIDLGPDVHSAAQQHGVRLDGVRFILQTHAHADHFDPSHLLSRSPGYGVEDAPNLQFYASQGTLETARRLLERDCAPSGLFSPQAQGMLNLHLHPVKPYQPFEAGDYQVIAFPADHDPLVEPLLYALTWQDKSLFYGLDTASLPEPIWQAFERFGLYFDVVVLDHTYGPLKSGDDHLNVERFTGAVQRFRSERLLKEGGRIFASHIAHDANPVHSKLSEWASDRGYHIAWDHLMIEV